MKNTKIPTVKFIFFASIIFFGVAFLVVPQHIVHAAALQLNPPAGSYVVGSVVSVDVLVDTQGSSVNAVSADITYDTDLLRAVSVSRTNSLVDLWLQEPAILSDETVSFEGLMLNPGFQGTGKVITVNFEVLDEGDASISFASGLVLANDGFGTNILGDVIGAHFSLLPGSGATVRDTLPPAGDGFVVDEDLLAPVVISYTENPATLDELAIRGVTYPVTPVNVYLQQDLTGDVTQHQVVSDAGGNFTYHYERDVLRRVLQTANVFTILDALSGSFSGQTFQFWLTAVRNNIETDPTNPFEIIVGGGSLVMTLIVALLLLIVVVTGLIVLGWRLTHHVKHVRHMRFAGPSSSHTTADASLVKDIKRDLEGMAYDIEKYAARDRYDQNLGDKKDEESNDNAS